MGFETDVAGLISATTGQPTAAYTYDPFGQLLSATGSAAAANPIRFSTRYEDPETSLLYYGYRFLHPATGRWLNRDPLGEAGGVNLYGFVGNNPSNAIDRLGLDWWIFHEDFGVIDAILAGGGGALDGLQNVGNAVIDTYKGAWGLGETIGDYGGAIKDGDTQFLKTKYDLAVFWTEFYGRIAKAAIEDECYRKQLWEQLSPGLKQQFGTADGLSKFFANLGIGAAFSAAGAQAKKGGLFSIFDELADMARLKKLPALPALSSGFRRVLRTADLFDWESTPPSIRNSIFQETARLRKWFEGVGGEIVRDLEKGSLDAHPNEGVIGGFDAKRGQVLLTKTADQLTEFEELWHAKQTADRNLWGTNKQSWPSGLEDSLEIEVEDVFRFWGVPKKPGF